MDTEIENLNNDTTPTAKSGGELSHGSLFSGIGGFELGAKMSGIETLWNCEINPFSRAVLKKNFPNVKQYSDIITIENIEYVDIISGGFPCQDISIAKKNAEGIKGKRSGLWSEMFRIIRQIRPKYIIIENSPMLLIRGFEQVLCDLSEIGYNAEWQCLSARTFGLNHKRERFYCIAYPNGIRRVEEDNENRANSDFLCFPARESCRDAIYRLICQPAIFPEYIPRP